MPESILRHPPKRADCSALVAWIPRFSMRLLAVSFLPIVPIGVHSHLTLGCRVWVMNVVDPIHDQWLRLSFKSVEALCDAPG